MAGEEPGASPGNNARRLAHDGPRRLGRLGRPAALAALAAATLCVTAACSSPSSAPASSAPPPATPAAAGSVAAPTPSAAQASGPATTPVAVPTPVARSGGVTATAASAAQIAMFTAVSAAESTDVSTNPLAGCHINPATDHLADAAVTNNGWAEATVVFPAGDQQGQENVFKRAHGAWAVYACGTSLVGGPTIPADVLAALGQVQAGLRAAGG